MGYLPETLDDIVAILFAIVFVKELQKNLKCPNAIFW